MHVPALTVNKVSLSGIDAIALADQLIRSGEYKCVIAGAIESISNTAHMLMGSREGVKFGDWTMIDSISFDSLCRSFDNFGMGEHTENQNARDVTLEDQRASRATSHQ
jgi:acetyl-CoA C-acetyltransferase